MSATAGLDLAERYLDAVRAILRLHVPDYDVWAYGSRVTGGAFAASDVDLVLRRPAYLQTPCDRLFDLRDAFVESDLPVRVDVMDWARLPDAFRREIEQRYVVVQTAQPDAASQSDRANAGNLKELGYGG